MIFFILLNLVFLNIILLLSLQDIINLVFLKITLLLSLQDIFNLYLQINTYNCLINLNLNM